MNWLPLLGALALTGFTIADPDPAAEQPVELQEDAAPPSGSVAELDPDSDVPIVETITLQAERYERLTVPVTIMGEGPFRFMVDTGSQATVLSAALAERLQLFDRGDATLVGMASSRAVQTTMVPDFELGSRTFTIRTAPIVAGENIGRADGILGLDSLQDQRVLLDFEHGILSVSDSFESGGASGYDIIVRARERLGQLIIHRAEIDGIRTAVIIDTGAQSSFGNLALRERLRRRGTDGNSQMTDVNGVEVTGQVRIVRHLEMDNVQLNNIPVSFLDSPTFHALGLADRPALILGMSELRMFRRVAIDFRSRRVLFDLPANSGTDHVWNFNERASRL